MIRSRSFFRFIFAFSIFASPFIYGMQGAVTATEPKRIAFSFDLDDVISGKDKVGFNDFLPLVGMFWTSPMLATAAWPSNQQAITDHAQNLTEVQKYNGSTNIIRGVIQYLKDNGYGDVFSYEKDINKRTQKPFPVLRMVANIQALRALGHPVFGATNQDCEQYRMYREHLKTEHKIDLTKIFDGVVTTRVYHHEAPVDDRLVYKHKEDDHIYVLRNREDVKPNPSFFNGVAQVIKSINSGVEQIIHTDDKQENTLGAEKAGLNSIHFKLPTDSVRKTSPEDLEATIDTWESELANTYGIVLKK
jgi:hypothetical protein